MEGCLTDYGLWIDGLTDWRISGLWSEDDADQAFIMVMLLSKRGRMTEIKKLIRQQYRKKDPADSEEVEFMENIFNSMCSILGEPEVKKAFVEAEGVELMIIMMK